MVPSNRAGVASSETEPALRVVTLYQDSLTRQWTAELWGRVEKLVGLGGGRHRSWKIGDLMKPDIFAESVQAAREADVLVVSVRDAGELPMSLYMWVDAWLPNRTGREGALVALIGVPSQPDAQSGRAHAYLESVARQAGLDFLPRERKLPGKPAALANLSAISPLTGFTMRWEGGKANRGSGFPLRWGFVE